MYVSDGSIPAPAGEPWSGAGPVPIRSIPAPAGEPGPWESSPPSPGVYPRACGGTEGEMSPTQTEEGLSPRLRGNLMDDGFRLSSTRSIPAPAGEPCPGWTPRPNPAVYPRACGGTNLYPPVYALSRGLSPRLRGNLDSDIFGLELPGSIPAPAGEPWATFPLRHPWTVYPRACGGTTRMSATTSSTVGLSPRLRGNPGQSRTGSG